MAGPEWGAAALLLASVQLAGEGHGELASQGEPPVMQASSQSTGEAGDPASSLPGTLVLPRDTPVHLMATREVTTKTHGAGHRFQLRVTEAVEVGGEVVIPAGATAWGEVTSAERSGNLGKSGQLSAQLLFVQVGGSRIAIVGERTDRGKSGTAETVMGVIGLGVFGLFAKGNNAKIKAGEMFTAFTRDDTVLPASTKS